MMGWIALATRLLPLIMTAVQAVERLSSKHGKDKQNEAVALVGDLVPLLEAGLGRDIVDDQAVQTAIRMTIDAAVALQNTIAGAKARLG